MAVDTFWNEYQNKCSKYDLQIDREWDEFNGIGWDCMTTAQKDKACMVAERQGMFQRRMLENYERNIRG